MYCPFRTKVIPYDAREERENGKIICYPPYTETQFLPCYGENCMLFNKIQHICRLGNK